MVAHVLEVPRATGVVMDRLLPGRIVAGRPGTPTHLVDRVPLRGDGEGQPFADEPHIGTPQVVQGPEEYPHPGVVADAAVHLEGEGAAAG